MNTLTDAQRERVLALLRAGKSLRRIENETGHRRETIATVGRRAGVIAPRTNQVNAMFGRSAGSRRPRTRSRSVIPSLSRDRLQAR
jgi:IS30 family transposase